MTKGTLTARLEARPRKTYPVDLADVFRLEAPAPALVRVSRKGEDDTAIMEAYAYVERVTKPLGPEASAAARADADLLGDAKTKGALARVFRDASDPEAPAFPSGDWIGDNLSTDEIAALTNIYAEVRRVDARAELPDQTGTLVVLNLLADLAERGSETPGVVLAPYPREIVVYMLVETAVQHRVLERRMAELEAAAAASAPASSPAPPPTLAE